MKNEQTFSWIIGLSLIALVVITILLGINYSVSPLAELRDKYASEWRVWVYQSAEEKRDIKGWAINSNGVLGITEGGKIIDASQCENTPAVVKQLMAMAENLRAMDDRYEPDRFIFSQDSYCYQEPATVVRITYRERPYEFQFFANPDCQVMKTPAKVSAFNDIMAELITLQPKFCSGL